VVLPVLMVGILLDGAASEVRGHKHRASARSIFDFDLDREYENHAKHYWAGLREISRLPDDLTIATSEVGLPGALNPAKNILDLAGLNHTGIATGRISPTLAVENHRSDIIYLHPGYLTISRDLYGSDFFKSNYDLFPMESLGARMPVAIYKSSRHHAAMKAILEGHLDRAKPDGRSGGAGR